MASVALEDVRQIIEDLFMGYIRNIPIPDTKGWYLEYFPNSKETAICFKRMNDVPILQQYITGGYQAAFSFTISMQASVKDTRHNLDITKPLNDLAATFAKETQDGFPNLKLTDAIPISLEMTSTPVDDTGEKEKTATFVAAYRLIYEKKGAFE